MIKSLLTFLIICISSQVTGRDSYHSVLELFYAGVLIAPPGPPRVGAITQPGCTSATGSVVLSDLPRKGSWVLTRSPGGVKTTGKGSSITINGLLPGTYFYTVTDASGSTSGPSSNIIINNQPASSPVPIQAIDCSQGSGKAVISVVSPLGTGLQYRMDGGTYQSFPGFTGVANGSHAISVKNSSGCITTGGNFSVTCMSVTIVPAPAIMTITQPTCILSTGGVVLSGLPATGSWILTRYPGTVTSTGTGTGIAVSGLLPGTYNYTVTNSQGSTSPVSANVIINAQPPIPTAPVVGAISQPSCNTATGSVSLTGLYSGAWTLTRFPDGVITTGTSASTTVSGLKSGIYSFILTNSSGCTSVSSASVSIDPQPTVLPKVIVTNPAPVCAPATVNLKDVTLTMGSTKGLTYTYWTNPEATIPYLTPATAGSGVYYINGITTSGCSDIEPVTVTVIERTLAYAGPDQILENLSVTSLSANDPGLKGVGKWTVIEGNGEFLDSNYARTSVMNLSSGKNIFLWTVSNGVCPPSSDSVAITVRDFVIPTLITPNHDGKNDYLIIGRNLPSLKTELIIFDRRGVKLYLNENYDNKWDGVDINGNPLPDDTYFYIIKTSNARVLKGYVVLRR